jgi:alpha-mannosidase
MSYDEILVLIPSHSLEDFPSELSESDAESILNAFAIAWDPRLLLAARSLPKWHRADDPPAHAAGRIVFVPTNCESWLPGGWCEQAISDGARVIRGLTERQAMLRDALRQVGIEVGADTELEDRAADFHSLGFHYLQLELLTRKMRHFSNLDEVYLKREALGAAEAALAGDVETTFARLKQCFDTLLEARHRFYSVESWVLDLCLLSGPTDPEPLLSALKQAQGLSLLVTANDLEAWGKEHPSVLAAIQEGCERDTVEVICGGVTDAPLPLLPASSNLWHLRESRRVTELLLRKASSTWGLRRFGVSPLMPQSLKRLGFEGALHFVLDDGIYPDYEHAKFRWEGLAGTPIDAISRIPLAADTATSYLKLPDRISESMDNDQCAAVILARWPGAKSPFLVDLHRAGRYAHVLGRVATFREFFERTDFSTRSGNYRPREYLSPFYVQAVAREEADPVSRFARHRAAREELDLAKWFDQMRLSLLGRPPAASYVDEERDLENVAEPRAGSDALAMVEKSRALRTEAAGRLGQLIGHQGGETAGYLVLNPRSNGRRVAWRGTGLGPVVRESDFVQGVDGGFAASVSVPGCGFVWLPKSLVAPSRGVPRGGVSLADEWTLRNDFFEVRIHPERGGIQEIRPHGRAPALLSQQLNYRFAAERTFVHSDGETTTETKTHYGEMRGDSLRVVSTGPAFGEIVSTGRIVDQKNVQVLARYTQTVRVWRGRPVVELDVELEVVRQPEGEAWHSYYASRWAWPDETAATARSVGWCAVEATEERWESAEFLEVATESHRVTLVPHGLPFHRKSGGRMLDTILIAAGESKRNFKLSVVIDEPFPYAAALDADTPPIVLEMNGPPRSGAEGWLVHVESKSVQLVSLEPVLSEPPESYGSWHRPEPVERVAESGMALRLVESEGRPIRTKVRAFRTPRRARQRDFAGKTIMELPVEGDAVVVDLGAYEMVEVELLW